MRLLFIHAHYDDYEFTAAGTFEQCRLRLGAALAARVIVCTDGAAGHQFRTRTQTARLRLREQRASARLGGYEFALLRYPDGTVPREACLAADRALLAALWKAIRDFEPDYVFCPPLPADPRVGVHVDHAVVAEAVRRVAYLINVPHAFTPEYPADETRSVPCTVPVILQVYDGYLHGSNAYDIAVDVTAAFDAICAMSWCHQSQIREWLPWVGRHHQPDPPASRAEWAGMLQARFQRQQRELGLSGRRWFEVFTVTAWGEVPTWNRLARDFPGLVLSPAKRRRLQARLRRWRGA